MQSIILYPTLLDMYIDNHEYCKLFSMSNHWVHYIWILLYKDYKFVSRCTGFIFQNKKQLLTALYQIFILQYKQKPSSVLHTCYVNIMVSVWDFNASKLVFMLRERIWDLTLSLLNNCLPWIDKQDAQTN